MSSVIWIVVVALAALPLAAEAGGTTAAPAAAQSSGTIIPLPGAQVFPESVAVDRASGRYWVTSVKDGTIFTGVVGSAAAATAFSPAGADGRTIATGIAYASGRLAVAGRQTRAVTTPDGLVLAAAPCTSCRTRRPR